MEDTRRITRGLSSDLVFRIVVRGAPFLLRIVTRFDERTDPARHFACMKLAADAGLAPRVLYANAEDGVAVTGFVDTVPFSASQALAHLPATLRSLHALPPFPKTFNYATAHNGFIWRLRSAGLLPKDEIEEVFTRYEQICAAYPRLDSDMVSSHMDLKPENILFDGRRVWLVDWQAAFLNDRYFDLSVVANFAVTSDAEEQIFLEKYFGRRPDQYEQARFFLMRQVVHMFYAAVLLLLGSAGRPLSPAEPRPSFGDFHRRIWSGDINLADNDLKIVYGLIHWERLLHNARQARFDEMRGIVAGQNGSRGFTARLLPCAP